MPTPGAYAFGPFRLVRGTRELLRDGDPVPLPPKAFDTLLMLVEHRDRVVSKEELRTHLWPGVAVEDGSLTQQIFILRHALSGNAGVGGHVATVARHGYRFVAPVEEEPDVSIHLPADVVRASSGSVRWPIYLLGLVAATLAGTLIVWYAPRPRPAPSHVPQRLTLDLPADAPLAAIAAMPQAADFPALAISRDGARLVYVAQTPDGLRLHYRDMATGATRSLPGTEGGHTPFFSPDGEWLGFLADTTVQKTRLAGGMPVPLADVVNPWGATWGDSNTILLGAYHTLFELDPVVGTLRRVSPDVNLSMPAPLPAGRGVVANTGGIERSLGWFKGATLRRLTAGFGPRVTPSGHIVYGFAGRLMAAALDSSRGVLAGAPVTLATDLRTAPYGVAQFAVSDEGTLVYVPGRDLAQASFVRVDRHGQMEPLGLPEQPYGAFSVSPDGRWLAAEVMSTTPDPRRNIWIYDLVRHTSSPLTGTTEIGPSTTYMCPRWSPDGQQLIYGRKSGSEFALVQSRADGDGSPMVLWRSSRGEPDWLCPMSFSPDGAVLAAFGSRLSAPMDVFTLHVERARRSTAARPNARPFIHTSAAEMYGQFSPDGRSIVYLSNEPGQYEVFVTPYPAATPRCQVSRGGAMDPAWSEDGSEVRYKVGTALFAARVDSVTECRTGEPTLVFDGPFPDRLGFSRASLGSGEFVMLRNEDSAQPVTRLRVITHLFEELRRLIPK